MFLNKVVKPETARKLRDKAGMSREELALLMDCSVGTIVNRETKECKMSLKEFEKLLMVTSLSKEDREQRKLVLKEVGNKLTDLMDSLTS